MTQAGKCNRNLSVSHHCDNQYANQQNTVLEYPREGFFFGVSLTNLTSVNRLLTTPEVDILTRISGFIVIICYKTKVI
jgi:hypothetical protein